MNDQIESIVPERKPMNAKVVASGWCLLLLGFVLSFFAYAAEPKHAAFAHLVGFLFLTSIAIGALFYVALEYLSGAVWSVPMRRVNEFLAALIPFAALFALPLFFHLFEIFPWAQQHAASDALLQSKRPYLNLTFFIIRFVFVFFVLTTFYLLFTRNSQRQDIDENPKHTWWNIRLSAVFMPIFAVGLTLIAIDWAMSLEAHWYSTIYGIYYFSGIALAGVSTATYVIVKFHDHKYFSTLRPDHFYSLGTLMFVFVNFWAYIAFSQFLLIWYANLPEETIWFLARWNDGWQYVSILLIIVHFAVPYFVLLPQDAKMDPRRLKFMALWILAAQYLDLYWLVMPSYSTTPVFGWMEIGFVLFIIGLIIVLMNWKMKRINLLPIGDPKLQRGLQFHL